MAISKRIQNGRASYRVQVRDIGGEWYPQKSFETKSDARAYEAQLLEQKRKGVKAVVGDIKFISVSNYYADRWAVECRTETSDGWKTSQDQMFRDHIEPLIGSRRLIEVDRSDILKVLAAAKTKGLGGQMRLHIFNLLSQIFDSAVEIHELRESNPVLKKFKPEPPVVAHKFLKPNDAREFIQSVETNRYGPAIWIMIFCGLRSCEVIGLQWADIDLDAGSLLIQRQWVRKEKRFGPTKNGKPILVPMPPHLVEYLSHRRPLDFRPSDYVIHTRTGGHVAYHQLYQAIRRLTREAGVEQMSPHKLRHTCTELWVEAGATAEDIRRLLNQSSTSTAERYIHRTDERLTGISARVTKTKTEPKLRRVK